MNITTNWKNIITKCIDTNFIDDFLNEEYKLLGDDVLIFPPKNLIYNCFNFFNFEDTKIVILGQDPYINVGEAMGLCFSVPNECKMPPSLRNIFKEIKNDIGIENKNKDLTSWAKQGILLLNTSLTVRQYNSNSHKKVWKKYTDKIINYISKNHDHIIFVLWGRDAQSKKKFINDKHTILESAHPSPFSANRGFFGNKHFSKINELLKNNNLKPIDWST